MWFKLSVLGVGSGKMVVIDDRLSFQKQEVAEHRVSRSMPRLSLPEVQVGLSTFTHCILGVE